MDERQLWLQAVEAIKQDINSTVSCPACNSGYLEVIDVPFDHRDKFKGGERYLKCSNCNRVEIVLYRNPPENWLSSKTG
jgi:transposase-like protein